MIHTLIIWASRRQLAAVKGGDVSGCIWIVIDQNWCVNCSLPRAVSGPRVCRLDFEQVKWGDLMGWQSWLTESWLETLSWCLILTHQSGLTEPALKRKVKWFEDTLYLTRFYIKKMANYLMRWIISRKRKYRPPLFSPPKWACSMDSILIKRYILVF